jgi:hypothetical protein
LQIGQPPEGLEVSAVQGNTKERWLELCEQAASEQDSAKLYALVQEINRLLEEKRTSRQRRLPSPFTGPNGVAEV